MRIEGGYHLTNFTKTSMLYYFSGTRNSRHAAMRIGSISEEDVRFIPETDPYLQTIVKGSDNSVGFVFPVYAWGVPPIVLDFIDRLPETFVQDIRENGIPIWCVATCGDETGMAVDMLRKRLRKKGLELAGAWSVIMPNVYVLLPGFGTDPKEVETRKLHDALVRLEYISDRIKTRRWEYDVHIGPWPRVKTSVVYPLFKKWGVNTKKWHYTDSCIGCGKCAGACPVGNIALVEGHPRWGTDCTSCCACFHVCPTRGAQYGRITEKAGQYFFNSECMMHNS